MPAKKVENRGRKPKGYVATGEPKKAYVPTGLPRGRRPMPDHLKKPKAVYVPKKKVSGFKRVEKRGAHLRKDYVPTGEPKKGPYVPTGKPRGRPKAE